ncbi:hypothetical protein HMI56_003458 [Coelomomyces lativittatus]|nr:hypothetical protein HMI56_003458 [Coelomomyces lativittatus]
MTQGDDFFPSKPNESSFKEDPSLLNQVNACYTLIQQLEPMLPLIPMILDRLLSLQILHMEASETLVGLQRWMQLMSTLQSETHCLKKQCDTLTESIQLNKAQMEQNTFVLLEKIQSLEKKLASANE